MQKIIIEKYNKQVPRYTSYPTAPHFVSEENNSTYQQWLGELDNQEPISLYLHIPFCNQLCYYCGCNTRIVNKYDGIASYVQALLKEIKQVASLVPNRQKVAHIAWGGGTPNILNAQDFQSIMNEIKTGFEILPDAEIAMEMDPRTITDELLDAVAEAGINRVSFGVQDFDLAVQEAINRVQPYEVVAEATQKLRAKGISKINFDLIYGLPLQTIATIKQSVDYTLQLRPSRIALFAYAHVPWMKKHQKLLEKYTMPTPEERAEMVKVAEEELAKGGYIKVGMDHFALSDDELVIAQTEKRLKRNFQGYTTDNCQTMLGLGASSIGCLPQGYIQNKLSVREYCDDINAVNSNSCDQLSVAKSLTFTESDKIRRQIINELMCNGIVDLNNFSDQQNFISELAKLSLMQVDGLVTVSNRKVEVTSQGEPLIRVIASVFDEYLETSEKRHAQAV